MPKHNPEQKIVIISPFYNAETYIGRCIVSVAAQDYNNYKHILIDDCSTDNSIAVVANTINKLPEDSTVEDNNVQTVIVFSFELYQLPP